MRHSAITLGFMHRPHNWEYATSAARLAATGFSSTDVGKLSMELDTFKFFVLSDDQPPTWIGLGFENPMTTQGDLIYGGTGGAPTRLAPATAGYELAMSSGGVPYWRATSGGTTTGGAGTKTIARFSAKDNDPPASTYGTLDTRNSIPVIRFDAALDEAAVFQESVPEAADLTVGLAVYIHWMADTAVAGTVVWSAEFEAMAHDLDADNFLTAVTVGSTAPATAGWPTSCLLTTTTALIAGLTAGVPFRIRIKRLGATASADDMSGDAELFRVEVRTR